MALQEKEARLHAAYLDSENDILDPYGDELDQFESEVSQDREEQRDREENYYKAQSESERFAKSNIDAIHEYALKENARRDDRSV